MIEVTTIERENKYAHNNLGYAYARIGRIDEAKKQFETALKLDPKYENAKKNIIFIQKEILKKSKMKNRTAPVSFSPFGCKAVASDCHMC